jgi:hypothetical protein
VPENQLLLTVIPFGYPTEKLGAGKKNRKPLSQVAHAEQLGVPYSK